MTRGNWAAERLYARHGFEVYGTEPRPLKHEGRYGDEAQMVRYL